MAAGNERADKLVDVFNSLWKKYHDIDESSAPTNSPAFQASVDGAIKDALTMIENVRELSMFSDNETLDEISTQDLRFFLLHALAASLNGRRRCDTASRPGLIETITSHYLSFLKQCSDYEIGDSLAILKDLNSEDSSRKINAKKDLASMNADREAKIAHYRKAKLQARMIEEMESKLHDEEVSRKYWLLQIEKWINTAQDEIKSMKTELEMLNRFRNVPKEEIEKSRQPKQPAKKPFILTKDKLQAAVFGAGYPSVPTMTLDEFYEKERAAGRLPDQASKPAGNAPPNGNDSDAEASDDEKIKKQREFDDWKDTHRRGAGNRKNMG